MASEFDDLRHEYAAAGLSPQEWEQLRPIFPKESAALFESRRSAINERIQTLQRGPSAGNADEPSMGSLSQAIAELTAKLDMESTRARKYAEVRAQVKNTKLELKRIKEEVSDAEKSPDRIVTLRKERRQAYLDIFRSFEKEQEILLGLYQPLAHRLSGGGTLERKLEFRVSRNVDLGEWVSQGEQLLDLRKGGPFQGRGSLAEVARQTLYLAWKSGTPQEIESKMEDFISKYWTELRASMLPHVTHQDVGAWLLSTNHVCLRYGISYEGTDLSKLSPGMRGIVLLVLYLSIDQWDSRPLLIDQPEENLDPQSVYDDLVRYFRGVKRRRQVILVTHNANLVVNADADQVIVASAERTTAGGLPNITYRAGGIEDQEIRDLVCRILEGGERAFLEREKRYGLQRDLRKA